MRVHPVRPLLAICAIFLVGLAGCGDDPVKDPYPPEVDWNGFTVPASSAGIWTIRNTVRDVTSGAILAEFNMLDTLCVDDFISVPFARSVVTDHGDFHSAAFDSTLPAAQCNYTVSIHFDQRFTDESTYLSDGIYEFKDDPLFCSSFFTARLRITQVGRRTSAPNSCPRAECDKSPFGIGLQWLAAEWLDTSCEPRSGAFPESGIRIAPRARP